MILDSLLLFFPCSTHIYRVIVRKGESYLEEELAKNKRWCFLKEKKAPALWTTAVINVHAMIVFCFFLLGLHLDDEDFWNLVTLVSSDRDRIH